MSPHEPFCARCGQSVTAEDAIDEIYMTTCQHMYHSHCLYQLFVRFAQLNERNQIITLCAYPNCNWVLLGSDFTRIDPPKRVHMHEQIPVDPGTEYNNKIVVLEEKNSRLQSTIATLNTEIEMLKNQLSETQRELAASEKWYNIVLHQYIKKITTRTTTSPTPIPTPTPAPIQAPQPASQLPPPLMKSLLPPLPGFSNIVPMIRPSCQSNLPFGIGSTLHFYRAVIPACDAYSPLQLRRVYEEMWAQGKGIGQYNKRPRIRTQTFSSTTVTMYSHSFKG